MVRCANGTQSTESWSSLEMCASSRSDGNLVRLMNEVLSLAHREYGSAVPDKPSVVLLHPFPFDRRMWQQVAPSLASAGWHVIVPDLRGCGESALGESEPDIAVLAHDVWALLDDLQISRPVVLGISLGGYVTMAMLRSRPSGLTGIGLIDTKATSDHPEAQVQRRAVAHHMRTEADVHAFADAMVPRLISDTTVLEHPEVATAIHEWILQTEPLTIAWLQEAMAGRPDSVADLTMFSGAALLLRGSEDVVCSEGDYEVMQLALSNSTYVEIEGCGHLPPIENSQVTSAAIASWLDSI